MRRISVEEVKAAYEKTGLKPRRETWFDGCCACALSACIVAEFGDEAGLALDEMQGEIATRELAAEKLATSERYVFGFVSGFDDCIEPLGCDDERAGYDDGRAAAAAVFGTGATP